MKSEGTQPYSNIMAPRLQYVIPPYQRHYDWSRPQWTQLWEDIVAIAKVGYTPDRTHYMGAIYLYKQPPKGKEVNKCCLTDGQQRLTTKSLFLAALRDILRCENNLHLAESIDTDHLINSGDRTHDKYKLMPGKFAGDRDAYIAVMESKMVPEGAICDAYHYFKRKLMHKAILPGLDRGEQLYRLYKAAIDSTVYLVTYLGAADDQHTIFDRLNSTGKKLRDADHVRNYVFLLTPIDWHNDMYATLWRPMEELLAASALAPKSPHPEDVERVDVVSEYIRHFLLAQGNQYVPTNKVYYEVRRQLQGKTEADVKVFLQDLSSRSRFYAMFRDPEKESNLQIRLGLTRLSRHDVSTVYPFLLNVYQRYHSKLLTPDEVRNVLDALDNFLVRRYFCSVPSSDLTRFMGRVHRRVLSSGLDYVQGVKAVLASMSYPSDEAFAKQLASGRIYRKGEGTARCRNLLERLETSFNHPESPDLSDDNITIEHIMPQNKDKWLNYKGARHSEWVNNLGNLTLTGMNGTMSDKSFGEKKDTFKTSHIQLSKELPNYVDWDEQAVHQRGEALSRRALTVWPHLNPQPLSKTVVQGERPVSLTILGEYFRVSSWKEVLSTTVEALANRYPERVSDLETTDFLKGFISDDAYEMAEPRELAGGYFYDVARLRTIKHADRAKEFCEEYMWRLHGSTQDWKVETEKDLQSARASILNSFLK